ncbi:MAG: hypothetical protein OEY49_08575, partial [Candidatus Heimdallarchaeota archaeon]|nr:hypothetical protein [Candidatus Heimdallarchaeota archaeon]
YNHDTDPNNSDTDYDGMPDGWEILHEFNPLSGDGILDRDVDGLSNTEEYLEGTDPSNSDTDDDGMPDGWEVDNSLDPLIDDGNLDMDTDGLNNLDEFTQGTTPSNPDSDADGMPDGWEVANSLDPLNNDALLDPDSDGLTNAEEYQLELDPNDADTDGDGIVDGFDTNKVYSLSSWLNDYFIYGVLVLICVIIIFSLLAILRVHTIHSLNQWIYNKSRKDSLIYDRITNIELAYNSSTIEATPIKELKTIVQNIILDAKQQTIKLFDFSAPPKPTFVFPVRSIRYLVFKLTYYLMISLIGLILVNQISVLYPIPVLFILFDFSIGYALIEIIAILLFHGFFLLLFSPMTPIPIFGLKRKLVLKKYNKEDTQKFITWREDLQKEQMLFKTQLNDLTLQFMKIPEIINELIYQYDTFEVLKASRIIRINRILNQYNKKQLFKEKPLPAIKSLQKLYKSKIIPLLLQKFSNEEAKIKKLNSLVIKEAFSPSSSDHLIGGQIFNWAISLTNNDPENKNILGVRFELHRDELNTKQLKIYKHELYSLEKHKFSISSNETINLSIQAFIDPNFQKTTFTPLYSIIIGDGHTWYLLDEDFVLKGKPIQLTEWSWSKFAIFTYPSKSIQGETIEGNLKISNILRYNLELVSCSYKVNHHLSPVDQSVNAVPGYPWKTDSEWQIVEEGKLANIDGFVINPGEDQSFRLELPSSTFGEYAIQWSINLKLNLPDNFSEFDIPKEQSFQLDSIDTAALNYRVLSHDPVVTASIYAPEELAYAGKSHVLVVVENIGFGEGYISVTFRGEKVTLTGKTQLYITLKSKGEYEIPLELLGVDEGQGSLKVEIVYYSPDGKIFDYNTSHELKILSGYVKSEITIDRQITEETQKEIGIKLIHADLICEQCSTNWGSDPASVPSSCPGCNLDTSCLLCRRPLTKGRKTYNCSNNHRFHEREILEWKKIRGTCPVCKVNL